MRTPPAGLRALGAALTVICTALVIVFSSAPPASAYTVKGAIGNHYQALGGAAGRLGAPTSNERCGLRDSGCYQSFQGGSIHWTRASGAHATWGAIRNAWRDTGWENGKLRYPTTNERCGLRDSGCYQTFQGGSIHWSPASGAHATWGGIRSAWSRTGWENGKLRYPTTNERCGLRNSGCYQTFQGGSIHWSPNTGAHPTWGAIRSTWRDNGWEKGRLGYPKSDEYSISGGMAQDFEFGRITWKPGQGTTVQLTAVPSSFELTGSGFGHGVGMSQYGARGMAAAGKSATEILEHYYRPAKVESISANANADIRVQLLTGTQSVTISPNSGMLRVKAGPAVDDHWHPITLTRTSDNRVKAQVGDQTYTASWISVEWQNTRYWPGGTQPTTVSVDGARAGSTGQYRHGRIEVGVLNNSLNAVNVLRVNTEYMRGIAEMPTSWNPQALRAQAIAARTYAYRNLSSLKADCSCHVYDEVRSQVFAGWTHENGSGGSNWTSAVAATQTVSGSNVTNAQVVRHNGALIDAVYSSSSGGTTNRAADVWGSDVPYLQERDDAAAHSQAAGNPYSSWTTSVTQARMRTAFGLADVADLQITRTGSGMVKSIRAVSSTGAASTRTGPQLRTALGLRSATFDVEF
ncbi:hypothetical protein GCM10022261_21350 [Brevibacterium daeguense]|uniref:Sporulation stage II protein D amidase enhancer LytB N-terminal domain-containing protein n=1 Tax=Brevibacterium daeguense TaxID=909936 RepID=A0ABP8EKT9_9MICO